MGKRFAEGQNYSIEITDGLASCRVWARPDLDSARGAELAAEKVPLFRQLAESEARGLLFNLALAPAVTGPKTQQALGEMLAAWQSAKKPLALVSGPHPIQQLQLKRLLQAFAPEQGALFHTDDEARAWLLGRINA